ncbi:hypothetical protein K502DRAFT_276848, partial [Neoconidiobolus thromboides FSU 785]
VIPGSPLGYVNRYEAGKGTYVHNGIIYSGLLGTKSLLKPREGSKKSILTVLNQAETFCVPEVGDVVTCKVIKILPKMAGLKILMVGHTPCADDYSGVIRSQDVRATDKDRVQIFQSFRPGDIVKAEVISLGDSKSYYLSTAKNELGVLIATSPAGETMIPISWQEMQCPKTKIIENRKCAKP